MDTMEGEHSYENPRFTSQESFPGHLRRDDCSRLNYLGIRAAGAAIALFGGLGASFILALSGMAQWVLSVMQTTKETVRNHSKSVAAMVAVVLVTCVLVLRAQSTGAKRNILMKRDLSSFPGHE